MSMVIMHMAMAIALMVELYIHNLDTGGGGGLSNGIRRNCGGRKKSYCWSGQNGEENRCGKSLNPKW